MKGMFVQKNISGLVGMTAALLLGGTYLSWANDSFPPCWRGAALTTWENWRFDTASDPAPPEEVTNPYGSPQADITLGSFGTGWKNITFGTKQGAWDLGLAGNITLSIPNLGGSAESTEYIQVQVGHFKDSLAYPLPPSISIAGASLVNSATNDNEFTPLGKWVTLKTLWRVQPASTLETVVIAAPSNKGLLIDQVIVDTRVNTEFEISGAIRYYSGTQVVPGTAVTLSGAAAQSVTTGSAGTYAFAVNPCSNYVVTPSKTTDSPANQGVTVSDLILIRRHILGSVKLNSPYRILAADVTGNKTVSVSDLIQIQRLILGNQSTFPIGLWKFVPSDYTFIEPSNPWASEYPTNRSYTTLADDRTGQDFLAIKLGDASANWQVALPSAPDFAPGTPNIVGKANTMEQIPLVSISTCRTAPGQTVRVPVMLRQQSHLSGIQFTMRWDPALLTFVSVGQCELPGFGKGNIYSEMPGTLTCVWDDPSGASVAVAASGLLFEAEFQTTGSDGIVAPIAFDNTPTMCELAGETGAIVATWQSGAVMLEETGRAQPVCKIQVQPGQGFLITILGAPGVTYTVECTDSLIEQNWRTLGTATATANAALYEYYDAQASADGSRFYRAVSGN